MQSQAPSWETGFVNQLRVLGSLGEEGLDGRCQAVAEPSPRPELGMQSQAPSWETGFAIRLLAGRCQAAAEPSRRPELEMRSQAPSWETGFDLQSAAEGAERPPS